MFIFVFSSVVRSLAGMADHIRRVLVGDVTDLPRKESNIVRIFTSSTFTGIYFVNHHNCQWNSILEVTGRPSPVLATSDIRVAFGLRNVPFYNAFWFTLMMYKQSRAGTRWGFSLFYLFLFLFSVSCIQAYKTCIELNIIIVMVVTSLQKFWINRKRAEKLVYVSLFYKYLKWGFKK